MGTVIFTVLFSVVFNLASMNSLDGVKMVDVRQPIIVVGHVSESIALPLAASAILNEEIQAEQPQPQAIKMSTAVNEGEESDAHIRHFPAPT